MTGVFCFNATRRLPRNVSADDVARRDEFANLVAERSDETVKRRNNIEILPLLLFRDGNLVGLCRTRYEPEANFHAGVRRSYKGTDASEENWVKENYYNQPHDGVTITYTSRYL